MAQNSIMIKNNFREDNMLTEVVTDVCIDSNCCMIRKGFLINLLEV